MSETFWAIKGRHGIYCGTWLTRGEAIAAHTRMLDAAAPGYYPSTGLTDGQKKAWNARKRLGDHAVKVRVIEETDHE